MGLHKNTENFKTAKRENSVILMEEDLAKYQGFDPKDPASYIIFNLQQQKFQEQSLRLAELVENQFEERVKRKSRGVKQAGFVVLWKTTMPSILVETGFLTNPQERAYLQSDQGQSYLASGIFRAFRAYKEEREGNANSRDDAQARPKTEESTARTENQAN
jgi:N-acetylmuramoyl-L-alanine amidase